MMRKTVALGMLLALVGMTAPDLLANGARRRARVHHRRIWVGRRIVVGRAFVVAAIIIDGRAHGVIDFDVEPEETRVIVDGTLRGQVDDFDGAPGKLHLLPGTHKLRLIAPDGDEWSEKVKVVAGHEINIKLELED